MGFQQEDFAYQDLYKENSYLKDVLHFYSDQKFINNIDEDLSHFSNRASGEILELMWAAEKSPPQLIQFDHWGKRIDKIQVHPAWDKLHAISAQEGMVAIGYERESKEYSRLHQFLKLLIFHPSSAFYTCPLAMTDGATRVLEKEGGELKKKYFSHLVSRDPEEFYTAGQWMTEKSGGSDVSGSETYAKEKNGNFYLYGIKWFTSAITADLAMVLAQTQVNEKKRLSLFVLKIRNQQGQLNNIEVLRLKDKLGSKAMPTAELKLNGTPADLIGELGEGVKNISTVLNISRLYNSVCATGTIYRLHSLIRDYSKKRQAFGKTLKDHVLHQETLIQTQATTNGCVHFVSALGVLLGRSETKVATPEELSMLRLFTPIAKLWTAKKSVSITSELIEAFGGAGYIEDTHLPRFLRDAQVFSIWEGTTNIMSLDALRALNKKDVFKSVSHYLSKKLEELEGSEEKSNLNEVFKLCYHWVQKSPAEDLELGAREWSFAMGDLYVGLLLLCFAEKTQNSRDKVLAKIFISRLQKPQFFDSKGRHERNNETLFS